mgnify:CR=1 FL=1
MLPTIIGDLLEKDHNMGKVFQYGRDANIALLTMGAFGPKSALVHTGYISQIPFADGIKMTADYIRREM